MSEKVSISIGGLEGSVESQLNQQGRTLGNQAEVFDQIANSVCRLYVMDCITFKQFDTITHKLATKIACQSTKL